MKRWCARTILMLMVGSVVGFALLLAPPAAKAAEDNGLFQQMDIGFLSIGGRATYVDPKDGSSRWFAFETRSPPMREVSRLSPTFV